MQGFPPAHHTSPYGGMSCAADCHPVFGDGRVAQALYTVTSGRKHTTQTAPAPARASSGRLCASCTQPLVLGFGLNAKGAFHCAALSCPGPHLYRRSHACFAEHPASPPQTPQPVLHAGGCGCGPTSSGISRGSSHIQCCHTAAGPT